MAAFTVAASSGTAQNGSAALPAPAVGNDTSRAVAPIAAAVEAPNPSGTLPRTGTGAAALAGRAVSHVVLGFGLRRLGVARAGR